MGYDHDLCDFGDVGIHAGGGFVGLNGLEVDVGVDFVSSVELGSMPASQW